MATAAQVAEFRAANQALVTLAQRELREFWRSLNVAGNPVAVRNALLAFFPEMLTVYGDAAALLGADWYDMLRNAPPSAARFSAALAASAGEEQAQATVRWAVGPLFEGQPDSTFARLTGAAQRLVLQPGRDSVWSAARADPVRTSFARVPSGPTTCRWCVMLAARGFDYSTAESAGQGREFHDHCDCVIVPGRGVDDLPEDYDLDIYKRLYEEHSGLGRDLPAD